MNTLHEPYELKQLEERFQELKPKAYKNEEENKLIFTCENEWYRKKIGPISEWLHYEHKVEALKLRAKLKFLQALQFERKLKICDCGKLMFNPKPWQDVCNECIKEGGKNESNTM
jgi:hypothetical protein